MNEICIVLYVNALYSQHLLNKPLTNRESNKLMLFPSQLFFSIVENLLRVYAVYYQYGYIIIHQFNKKRIVLQGFKLFPCDGVETTDSFYRLISALPIVIELVSGICKPVRGRSKFPTFLQYLSDLVLLHLYLRMYQQKKNVVVAERECVRADTFHNVKDKFAHLYLQSVAVAADNLLQGFCMQQCGVEPHPAFLFGGQFSVLQEMEKGGYLRFQLLQEVGIIGLQAVYLAYPIACFPCVYDYGQMLVVGAQHEFGEERNLVTVFAFGFHLIGKCGAEVLQPLAILPAVEQHLIHHDKQLASPVGIELAAEILVGVESHIVLKKGFQKVQEGA